MDNENVKVSNGQTVPIEEFAISFQKDTDAKMEKSVKFTLILSILSLVAAIAGMKWVAVGNAIYTIVVASKGLKIEEYNSKSWLTIIISIVAGLIVIGRLFFDGIIGGII